MPKINLKGVGDPMPIGLYPAVFTNFDFIAESKSSGQPMYNCEFTIADPEEYAGRKAWCYLSLGPDALWKFKQSVIALGADPEDLEADVDTDDIIKPLVGGECVLDIGINEYQGEKRNNIKNIKKAGVGAAAGANW